MKLSIFYFLLIFVCFDNPVLAQNDSLITALEQTLQIQLDSLEEEDLDIAMYCDSLAEMYMGFENYDKAKTLFAKALLIRVKKMGMYHATVADSYNNLGVVHFQMGGDRKLLAMFGERVFYINNNISHNLFRIYNRFDRYEAAEEHFKKALEVDLDFFGQNNLIVALDYDYLGWIYYASDDYEKAREYYQKVLNIKLDNFGEDHLEVANAYHKLATVYMELEEYDKAKKYYEKVLDIKLDNLQSIHMDLANAHSNLAEVCTQLKDYASAKEHYKKALDVRLINFYEYHIDIADSYHDLASICWLMKNRKQSRVYSEKALTIKDKNGLSEANSRNGNSPNLFGIGLGIKEGLKSEKYYKKALKIDSYDLRKNHDSLARYHYALSNTYRTLGKRKKVNYHNKKASGIYKYAKRWSNTDSY